MSCRRYLRRAAILRKTLSALFSEFFFFRRCPNPLSAVLTNKTTVDGSAASRIPDLNTGWRSVVNFLHKFFTPEKEPPVDDGQKFVWASKVAWTLWRGKHMSARRFIWLIWIRFVKYPRIISIWFFFRPTQNTLLKRWSNQQTRPHVRTNLHWQVYVLVNFPWR